MRCFRPLLVLGVLIPLFAADTCADDTPQFRGPGGAGVFTEAKPPSE